MTVKRLVGLNEIAFPYDKTPFDKNQMYRLKDNQLRVKIYYKREIMSTVIFQAKNFVGVVLQEEGIT